jgi:hypothetical protein
MFAVIFQLFGYIFQLLINCQSPVHNLHIPGSYILHGTA